MYSFRIAAAIALQVLWFGILIFCTIWFRSRLRGHRYGFPVSRTAAIAVGVIVVALALYRLCVVCFGKDRKDEAGTAITHFMNVVNEIVLTLPMFLIFAGCWLGAVVAPWLLSWHGLVGFLGKMSLSGLGIFVGFLVGGGGAILVGTAGSILMRSPLLLLGLAGWTDLFKRPRSSAGRSSRSSDHGALMVLLAPVGLAAILLGGGRSGRWMDGGP